MYDNIIFDLYGTLIDINTDESNEKLWIYMTNLYKKQNAIYRPNELKKLFNKLCNEEEINLKKTLKCDNVEININNVFKKLFEHKNINVNNKTIDKTTLAFRKNSTNYIKLYKNVKKTLNTLKKHSKKIYLLSNAQNTFTMYELKKLNLEKYFDGIILSSNELVKKPNPIFFDKLFNKYNLKKENSIMIGNDKTTDIKGAFEYQIDSIYIKSNLSPSNDLNITSKATFNIYDGNIKSILDFLLYNQ